MTPSFNVLISWNFTILVIISLPTLWKLHSWGGVVGGLSIALIVAVLVAARGDLGGDPWSESEPRTFKMFLGDVMYVVFGPLLFLLPAILAFAILSPILFLVALWNSLYLEALVILIIAILILVVFQALFRPKKQKKTDFKLLKIIKKAAVKNKTELEVRGRQLKKLPPEIGQLTNLTSLHLGENKLSSLPPEIGQLTNLTSLHLGENKLSILPPQIGQLTNLEILDIEDNKLSRLPPEIGELTNLSKLILTINKLRSLPSEIGQLTNLSSLRIDNGIMSGHLDKRNKLTSLPPEIGNLTKLSHMSIDKNLLKSLPPEIGNLTELTSLHLSGNQLRILPSEIRELTKLNYLFINENQLTSLPPEIGNLTELTSLDISRNQLRSLPSEIGQLTNLSDLDISENQLRSLPSEIGKLTNLMFLRISHNAVNSLPVDILKNIQLDLYVNGVKLTGKYKNIHPSRWPTKWLLSEGNAELRRLLIQVIGYERICQELRATELDAWREYALLKIDAPVDVEKICLLKMTCPSTGYIYAIRVPPDLESAREAIKWVNWGIDPEEFSVQT